MTRAATQPSPRHAEIALTMPDGYRPRQDAAEQFTTERRTASRLIVCHALHLRRTTASP
jgi:hypothetical protein